MASLPSLLCLLVVAGTAIMTSGSRLGTDGWIHARNGYRYRIVPFKASWHLSRHWCQQQGGDLAAVAMRDYWTRVYTANVLLLRDEFTWIGLSDLKVEKKWEWVDKKSASKNAHWARGEPNNRGNEDCAGINLGRDFRSNDATCGDKNYGLCEARIH